MKIALIGYGKMGKEIEKVALERGHSISLKVTRENSDYTPEDLSNSDVAIEFSVPAAAKTNIQKCFAANVPVVVGTTAWYDRFEELVNQCKTENKALFYASNFSLGVNLFWKLTEQLGQLMNAHKEYQPNIHEIHHTEKLDAPSGTAITTAEKLLASHLQFKNWYLNEGEEQTDKLAITADRLPGVPGTHTVTFQSDIDRIDLTHEAKNRKGFALGSVLAAEFLVDKKGVYSMNDLLGF